MHEFLILKQHYNISSLDLDEKPTKEFIKFSSPLLNDHIKNPIDYLIGLKDTFSKIKDPSSAKVYYTTRELPIFYYLLNPRLLEFKLFVFAKTVWEIPGFINSKFSDNMFHSNIFKLSDEIWELYSNLHSEEYWTINIIDATLQQLIFFKNCGDINEDFYQEVADALIEVLNKCSNMASKESKYINGSRKNFNLYENKILHTSNHIMVNTRESNFMFITFDNPNFIFTEDHSLMEYSSRWYDKIRKNSYSLGLGTGHFRFEYFNQITSKVKNLQ